MRYLHGLVVVALVVPASVRAQPAGNLPIDTFRPAIDSRGYLTLNASQVLGDKEVSFGLGSLSWGHRLLAFENGAATYSVDNVITATLIAAFGFKLGPAELQFGASAPLTIMNGDRGPDDLGAASDPNDDQVYKLDGQGIGNVGLHVKTRFLKTSKPPHIGLGLIASLYLPTATKDRFMGEDKLTPQLMLLADKELGRRRRLRIGLNAGVRLRQTTTFTDVGDMGAPATNGTITASAELPFGLGAAYAISPQRFDVVGELVGSVPLGNHEAYQPLEAVAGVKLYLARNSFLSLGVGRGLASSKGGSPNARAFIGIVFEPNIGDRDGDGLKDDVDRCPDSPEDMDGFEDEDGCPELDNDRDGILDGDDKCPLIPEDLDGIADEDGCPEDEPQPDAGPGEPLDSDGDKILDVDDLCPNDPEDYDGFEDEDGCPDLDNDRDKILDRDDKCPDKPESYNNTDDEDGCPDRGVIEFTERGFVPLQPINFELNKAVIKKDSYHILDGVVAALKGYSFIALLEVQGHTDEQGDDAYNLDLSERRAAAVMEYLVSHGIDPSRLTSAGYGETQPKIRERSQRAYAINRRVEFLIIKRAAP
ncbi:MAG TPA: OmpA family protein [Kofleriaceae bacterium]|nr:OmpA family protein [Kofleriaceae bacterium]